jgi:hypothetical protein
MVALIGLSGCGAATVDSTLPPAPTGAAGPASPGTAGPGTQGPSTPSSLGEAVLYHTQFATDIDPDGAPLGVTDAFPAGTGQILALVAWQYADVETDLRFRLFEGDRLVFEDSHVVANETGPGEAAAGYVIPMSVDGGFASAAYTAEIAYNGVPDEVATFTVGGNAPSGVIAGSGERTGPIAYKDPGRVLVVTRVAALRSRLGAATDRVLAAAARVGDLHDLEADGVTRATPAAAAAEARRLLGARSYDDVLIIGNDDVVPFFRVDNNKASTEKADLDPWELPAEWLPSDDPYVDLDGDPYGAPDLPIARIPSSEDAELLLTQLGTVTPPDGHAYSMLNQERRSQAGAVIATLDQHLAVQVAYAPPTGPEAFSAASANARYVYVLLHGIGVLTDSWVANLENWAPADPSDPFDGEWTVKANHEFDAINIASDPGSHGVVQVGACYGAWTLDTVEEPSHKTATNNLALHYLKSGTRAFIADTHLSYSAVMTPGGIPVARTGFEVTFWRSIGEGLAPIDAFFAAKQATAAAIDQLVAIDHPNQAADTLKTLHEMVYFGRP